MASAAVASAGLFGVAGACAFTMGYAANQGGTCAVAAMRRLAHHSDPRLLVGFLLAAAAGGLVCLPVAWLLGPHAHLPAIAGIGAGLLAGAVLLGIGAAVNGACLLGSLWRVGNGESRLLALPLGLAIGYLAATRLWPSFLPASYTRTPPVVTAAALLFLSSFIPVCLGAYAWLFAREGERPAHRWRLSTAMVTIGIAGALLYALQPGWTYADAVRRGVAPPMVMMLSGVGGLAAAIATVAGALVSAWRSRSFALRRPSVGGLARSIAGGALMAIGATLVPGGNDALLLAAIPSGSLPGVVAFVLMNAVILLLTFAARKMSSSAWFARAAA